MRLWCATIKKCCYRLHATTYHVTTPTRYAHFFGHVHHSHTKCSFSYGFRWISAPLLHHMLIFVSESMDFNTTLTPYAHFRILDPPLDPPLDAPLETPLDPALDAPMETLMDTPLYSTLDIPLNTPLDTWIHPWIHPWIAPWIPPWIHLWTDSTINL